MNVRFGRVVVVVALWLWVPARVRCQGTSAGDYARRIVTAAVEMPQAGVSYTVDVVAGARLVGPATGVVPSSRRLVVSLHVSEGFAAGRRQVATVRSAAGSIPVMVDVMRVRGLALSDPGELVFVPGQRESFVVVLSNRGNAGERITVSAGGGPGVSVSGVSAVEVAAGGSVRVPLRITAARGAVRGAVVVTARAGDAVAVRSVRYEVRERRGQVLPLALQAVDGPKGTRLSVSARGTWGDSVEVRLNAGSRPPPGFGQAFLGGESRALSVRAPAWGISVGEIRRSGGQFEPQVAGIGGEVHWGRPRGWTLGAALVRPTNSLASPSSGVDAAVRVERPVGATRLDVSWVSAGTGWSSDRLSLVALGARPNVRVGRVEWSADGGVAWRGGESAAVGRLDGSVVSGPLRFQLEAGRNALPGLRGLGVAEHAGGLFELSRSAVTVFGRGTVTESSDVPGGRDSESAAMGLRLGSGRGVLELRGGWLGADASGSSPAWGARVAGASLRARIGGSSRITFAHERAWLAAAPGGAQGQTSFNFDWSSARASAWLQGTHGRPATPYLLQESGSWRVGAGAVVRSDRLLLSVTGGIEAFDRGWRYSGVEEAAWRARQSTELLLGLRRLAWSRGPLEVFIGARQQFGLPLPRSGSHAAAERRGSLVVRVAFASERDGAVERVPRGVVKLRLPVGGEIEVPLNADGAAVLPSLIAGRYTVVHVAPADAVHPVDAVSRAVLVVAGRESTVQLEAAYLPRTISVVRLGSVVTAAPAASTHPRDARPVASGSSPESGSVTPACARPGMPSTVSAALRRGVIVPGMGEADVTCLLGAPAVRRVSGSWSYLFYVRSCRPTGVCDYDDVVFVQANRVVSAYLRGRGRRYEGPPPGAALIHNRSR